MGTHHEVALVALPPQVITTLERQAAGRDADLLSPWALAVQVLCHRLAHDGRLRAEVVRDGRRIVVDPEQPEGFADLGTMLDRSTLRPVAGDHDRVPVDAVVRFSGAADPTVEVRTPTDGRPRPTATAWARAISHLLCRLAEEPALPVDGHRLLDPAERHRVLTLNPYAIPTGLPRRVCDPIDRQARRTPDAVALIETDGTSVTYAELVAASSRYAAVLREHRVTAGTRVGILLPRSAQQVIAVHAVARTGAIYVPLEVDLPPDRSRMLLEDAAPAVVLTDEAGVTHLPAGEWEVMVVPADVPSVAPAPAPVPPAPVPPPSAAPSDQQDGVHLLYTSGTTGRPKGVVTTVGSVLANIAWMQEQYPYRPGDTALYKTSAGFDVSVWELFWPLHHGARVVIAPQDAHRRPEQLARLVEDFGVTHLFLVPTVLAPFVEVVRPGPAGALRWLIGGGESMPPWLRDAAHRRLPRCTLVNACGPTEAGSVTDNVIAAGSRDAIVPIGRPAPNFRVTVLDAGLDLLPVGVTGEAYVTGTVGLAHGYWHSPAATAERFVADPHGAPGERMYRTGDLMRYREDGRLEHHGRADRQLKVRGHRVEPAEVEAVLVGSSEVGAAVVLPVGDPPALHAFVTPSGAHRTTEVDLDALGLLARGRLAAHQRPVQIHVVDHIPATVNGKIDAAALRAVVAKAVATDAPEVVGESELVAIYARVLGRDDVRPQDSFLGLGGHSLLAFALLEACQAHFRREPDLALLLEGSVRDVARSLRHEVGAS